MTAPVDIPGIRNITISGRIGTGKTTLALKLGEALGWEVLDGGKIFRETMRSLGKNIVDSSQRPDKFDLEYEEMIKKLLKEEKHHIVQSHLAGFDAQGLEGVFKILVVCRDEKDDDKADIRIDRLMNRDGISLEQAKFEILEREKQNLEKFRRLYANSDPSWVYWDKKYYDLTVNTYSYNQEEALRLVLDNIGYKK
ncbi:MAG: (d)CMP kinase [Patescibacteria group bacterium]|nr:(d)CMP kinase [Patescibacteria group bacterium]